MKRAESVHSLTRLSLTNSLGATNSTSASTISGIFESFNTKQKFNSVLHEFCCRLVTHFAFTTFLMIVIVVNVVVVAATTNRTIATDFRLLFSILDCVFLAIYSVEFILKLIGLRSRYWKNHYNKFDFIILLVSIFTFLQNYLSVFDTLGDVGVLRVVQALRALRSLRAISIIPSLRVLFSALVKTIKSIFNLVLLLILILYIFGIIGYYLYADSPAADQYGSLGDAFLTLMCYVTIDEWTEVNSTLDSYDKSSRWFILAFVLLGHILFTNLFVGVVIQNLDVAIEESRAKENKVKEKLLRRKKVALMQRQNHELAQLFDQSAKLNETEMNQMMMQLKGKLQRKDTVPVLHTGCCIYFMECLDQLLASYENNLYRYQQLCFELSHTLAEITERKLSTKVSLISRF
ncbi:hypothetical protein RCL1_008127 [Eukaryota sp. TZLM3-RCL]